MASPTRYPVTEQDESFDGDICPICRGLKPPRRRCCTTCLSAMGEVATQDATVFETLRRTRRTLTTASRPMNVHEQEMHDALARAGLDPLWAGGEHSKGNGFWLRNMGFCGFDECREMIRGKAGR